MKTAAELDAIREKLRVEIGFSTAIDPNTDTVILIRMSDNGVKAAREIIKVFMDEIAKRNLVNVKVTQHGSVDGIDGEPIVEVTVPGKKTVSYTRVDAAKAREIAASINK